MQEQRIHLIGIILQRIWDFEKITENSIDAVSDRDFAIELTSDLSIIMMHLSRFCEEIILWASQEFAYIELDEGYRPVAVLCHKRKIRILQNSLEEKQEEYMEALLRYSQL